nr:glycoside hydrolase family 43 protein [Chitinophagaceae bacterium]
ADGYYMTTSTFSYFPGLPVFYSPDLLRWEQIGNAMDRNEQLPLMGQGVSRGLFAPAITYHKGRYYIVCTLVDGGGNFVITASHPRGPWSQPVYLPQVNGIDPSLFFDDNDSAYIVFNSIPPDNKTLWNGHRTIRMFSLDAATLQVQGPEHLLINGGTDTAKHPVWIEAPHIYKVNGYYYLMCAEGGTAEQHSEVIFRSKQVRGPWEVYSGNPILTQRQLPARRPNPITTAGHADMVVGPDGQWYAVFLACRPYSGDHYNIGRETFMLPVTWRNGWPHILEGDAVVPMQVGSTAANVAQPFGPLPAYTDSFNTDRLSPRWMMLRNMQQPWYQTGRGLRMQVRTHALGGRGNPSYLGFRLPGHRSTSTLQISAASLPPGAMAGLAVFQSEQHHFLCGLTTVAGQPVVQLWQSTADSLQYQPLATASLPAGSSQVQVRFVANDDQLSFEYSPDGRTWQTLKAGIDARFLSTKTAKGFVGSTLGPFAWAPQAAGSGSEVSFRWFSTTAR